MKYWISKYALSTGLQEVDVAKNVSDGGYLYPAGFYRGYKLDKDIHLEKSSALVVANLLRKKKIASLKKQLANLELLKFE